MITVNSTKLEWHEGMTIQDILQKMNYILPHIIVKVNGKIIPEKEYDSYIISDNANIEVIHIFHGG